MSGKWDGQKKQMVFSFYNMHRLGAKETENGFTVILSQNPVKANMVMEILFPGPNKQTTGTIEDPVVFDQNYLLKPMGFLLCQFQESRHISTRFFSAFQPSFSADLAGSA